MTFATLILMALAVIFIAVGMLKGWFLTVLGVIGTALLSLGLLQGDESPLVLLRSAPVSLLAVSMIVFAGSLSRVLFSTKLHRDRITWYGLIIFSVCIVLSGILFITSGRQWSVLATYMALLWLPFLFTYSCRFAPIVGLTLAALYQLSVALIGGYYVPTLSGVPQLSAGVQPNILALQAGLLGVSGLYVGLRQNLRWRIRFAGYCVALLSIVCILLTVSRSGLISAVVAFGLLVVLCVGSRAVVVSVLLLVTLVSFSILGGIRAPWMERWFVRGDAQSISSLTGRTDIWNLAIDMVSDRPALGWGFGALYHEDFSGGHFLRMVEGTNAHNAWLQIAVECGIAGLICLVVLFSNVCWRLWVSRKCAESSYYLAVLCLLAVNSFVSASFSTIGFAAMTFAAVLAAASWQIGLHRDPPVRASDGSVGSRVKARLQV